MPRKPKSEAARLYLIINPYLPSQKLLVEANKPSQVQRVFAQHFCETSIVDARTAIKLTQEGISVVRWDPKEPEQLDIEDQNATPAAPAATGYVASGEAVTGTPHAAGEAQKVETPVPSQGESRAGTVDSPPLPASPPARPARSRVMASSVFGKGFTRESDD